VTTLSWIIAVSLGGGLLSVLAAAAVGVTLGASRVNILISYAIGALLGAAFLEILPHALEHGEPHKMAATVLLASWLFSCSKSWFYGVIVIMTTAKPMKHKPMRTIMDVQAC
jgi:zinc transporter ZupT